MGGWAGTPRREPGVPYPLCWCPSPCPLPSPPDITLREEVWKHLGLRAGFLPRCAQKVYVPGGPQIFIESLLYDSA